MSPRKGLELRDILSKATEIADTKGVEAVTLATLARELKVKSPSLYNHVDGLNGLRRKLALYGTEKLYEVLSNAAVGKAGDSALLEIAEAYLKFSRVHPGLYDLTLTAPDQKDTELLKASEKILNLVLKVLEFYHLEKNDALHAVRGFRSIIHGFASLEQKEGFKLNLDRDDSYRFLVGTFLTGIHAVQKKEHE
ncbi:TetR/AcrR family transcriptional regulator [Bacillus horti]|uniref:AcrR family transcriptional regulator n=1 Tax=Caldalkalibacillus horti TaxID=77523 RepID=A0ABT9VY96_9BACI|nr:TetR-like C-terminal domain-containing protein [Bacillus horti]MDQ0165948.1 AcrR family transcriptional regulator [Bacillus horti]